MTERTVTLDVRDDLRQGRPPFDRIMAAVEALGAGERLRLLAPIKPTPMMSLLGRKGFACEARETEQGDWEAVFTPGAPATMAPRVGEPIPVARETGPVEVDARGLEPPEPMVKILEAAATLPPGVALEARTDRCPIHLLDELTSRGFQHRTDEQADGSFVTHIQRV